MARRGPYPPSVQPGIPKIRNHPEGWQKVHIGDLFDVVSRPAKLEDNQDYQLVTAKRNRGGIEPREVLPGKKVLTKTQFYVETDDFLISRRQIIHGACGLVPKSLHGAIVSNEYSVLRVTKNLDLNYLKYLIHTIYFQQTCFHASVGVALEKMIFKIEGWLKYPILMPPLSEQKKIAQILGTWDRAIDLTEQLIEAKKRQKKGLMQQLLTGKKRFKEFSTATSFEKSKLGLKPLDWECQKIEDVVNTFSGGTPSRGRSEFFGNNGDIPWIKSGELNQKLILHTNEFITKEGVENSSAKYVEPNTVLLALYGATAGVVGISKIRATINQAILALVTQKNKIEKLFLFYSLEFLTPVMLKKLQGGQPNLSADLVKKSYLLLPQIAEQQKIAKTLFACDQKIELLRKKLDALKEQKKGLMQQLLTGKVRVKV